MIFGTILPQDGIAADGGKLLVVVDDPGDRKEPGVGPITEIGTGNVPIAELVPKDEFLPHHPPTPAIGMHLIAGQAQHLHLNLVEAIDVRHHHVIVAELRHELVPDDVTSLDARPLLRIVGGPEGQRDLGGHRQDHPYESEQHHPDRLTSARPA